MEKTNEWVDGYNKAIDDILSLSHGEMYNPIKCENVLIIRENDIEKLRRRDVDNKMYEKIYNKAIDDFVEKLTGIRCECCGELRKYCSQGNYCFIDEIGERLKTTEGVKG